MAALAEAEAVIVLGTLYYPETESLSSLIRVSAVVKRGYRPGDARVVLGDHDLGRLVAGTGEEARHIWVSGRVNATDEKTLETARARGLSIICGSLFSLEELDAAYGDLFVCADRTLVPGGYEITGELSGVELPLYGKKIYVKGDFSMTEKDLPLLEEIGGIIVKGTAILPASAMKVFREKGRADRYTIFEGTRVVINGVERFSHHQLEALVKKGERLTLVVNGVLVFDEDVTTEDMDCIASLSYYGEVRLPGAAKAALVAKVKGANGTMGDLSGKDQAGLTRPPEAGGDDADDAVDSINTGFYLLA
jgi:hypothetical protein